MKEENLRTKPQHGIQGRETEIMVGGTSDKSYKWGGFGCVCAGFYSLICFVHKKMLALPSPLARSKRRRNVFVVGSISGKGFQFFLFFLSVQAHRPRNSGTLFAQINTSQRLLGAERVQQHGCSGDRSLGTYSASGRPQWGWAAAHAQPHTNSVKSSTEEMRRFRWPVS